MILLLTILSFVTINTITLHAMEIYRYDVPLVSIRDGNAWIINGNFKLVHVINLDNYKEIANNVTALVQKRMPPSNKKEIIFYHLDQVKDRLCELGNQKSRGRRSIDWIGSAWKWVAGNPDATDWNTVLRSQNAIITNNNEQYKINARLLNTANEVVQKTNELVRKMNEISNGKENEQFGQDTVNQVLVLKDVINEIVRACQLAKSGVINSNLLDKAEINSIIAEVETLPYANVIEAIEYGSPSVYTNGSLLLYVLSIPKLKEEFYHRLIVRTTIRNNKQIDLPFNEVLISQNETFGVRNPCLCINELTVCRKSSLSQLSEETCIPRLLKGGNASCKYKMIKTPTIEMIKADLVFLTNFEGVLNSQDHTETLNGTYLIRLSNETIFINDEKFSSTSYSKIQPLPPVLSSVFNEKLLVDIDQVHDISLQNVDQLQHLGTKLNLSLSMHTSIILALGVCIGLLWYKIGRRLNLPNVKIPDTISSTYQPAHVICGTQIFKEGGVNDTANSANKINLA